jgi:hypothetical protein
VPSRGESAYVVDVGPFYLASIVECLGTKTLVADEMARLTGRSYYAGIAQDTIAMAVNDLITVGATPLVVQAYWAAGGSDWFDRRRARPGPGGRLEKACDPAAWPGAAARRPRWPASWPAGRIDLAASCTGSSAPRAGCRWATSWAPGDAIVLLASSGIHANGLSLARKLAERLPQGYLTDIGNGPAGLRRGPAGPHHAVFAGDRGVVAKAGVACTTAPTSPATAGASCCATRGADLPHPHRAAGDAGAEVHAAALPAWTTARPTARSTWAPASRSYVAADEAEVEVRPAASWHRRLGGGHGGSRAEVPADRATGLRFGAEDLRCAEGLPGPCGPRLQSAPDGPPRMEARPTGSGGEPSSP